MVIAADPMVTEGAEVSKYDPLFKWLTEQAAGQIPTTFGQVASVLGFDLPKSSTSHPQWWANHPGQPQARAWLTAGFRTEDVDVAAETVVFVRF
jgi:hypothetical protein